MNLLYSENNILKWGAIIIISNLVAVDTKGKFEKIFYKYFALIDDKNMITASNIIKNSWKIALAKPEYTQSIVKELLKVENESYENKGELSPECKNIVCGNTIDSFENFYHNISDKMPVVKFIRKQLKNSRKPVANKAAGLFKKYNIGL